MNFLLGSYLTGMFFMFFHAEKMYLFVKKEDIALCRFMTGLFWPIFAVIFLMIRFSKAFYAFWSE